MDLSFDFKVISDCLDGLPNTIFDYLLITLSEYFIVSCNLEVPTLYISWAAASWDDLKLLYFVSSKFGVSFSLPLKFSTRAVT